MRWQVRLVGAVALCAALVVPAAVTAAPPDRAATTPVAEPTASASSISGAELNRRLNSALNAAGGSSGAWVINTNSGNVAFARGATTVRSLASNEKLFTTGTALDRFGSATRLQTSLWSTVPVDANGVVNGDLIVRGGGDPAVANSSYANRYALGVRSRLAALAERAFEKGIRRVTGQLYVDDTLFDRKRGVPASDYRTSYYIGPLSALTYNYGRAGGGFQSTPEFYATKRLKEALQREGVDITGPPGHKRVPGGATEVAKTGSPSFETLAAVTNKPSNNFFAEMILKGIGAAYAGGGTTSQGAAEVEAFALSQGAAVNSTDGSGLGRSNRSSPREVGQFLVAMREHAEKSAFVESLPRAAQEGTVANRMRGTAAAGRCRTKTGTLSGVSNLSGYCFNTSGKVMVFSILMSGVDVSNAQRQQDRMADAIARY